jgi:hypothetical protein
MKMKEKKTIEMTLDEAKILDGELYKLQLELTRKRWTVDEPPTAEDVKRSDAINSLREKVTNALESEMVEKFVNGL